MSAKAITGYATLDDGHIDDIRSLIERIRSYTDDSSQKRPLNFLMFASPGAGKSHFITCIAEALHHRQISAITFNMTALQTNEDLIPALDAARNLKVEDRVPLLFLDEFDSKPTNISLLLPLLWDGQLNLGQRDLKLGRAIIVLAGSDPSLPLMMDQARNMRIDLSIQEGGNPKIVDLLSRVNGGVVEIPPFYDPLRKLDRRVDKACIAIHLLGKRFGENLRSVPRRLLQFIVDTEFRYGARSVAHLIESIPYKKNVVHLRLDDLNLPLHNAAALKDSSLAYHLLHEEQAHGIADAWRTAPSSRSQLPVLNVDKFIPVWWRETPGDKSSLEYLVRRLMFAVTH